MTPRRFATIIGTLLATFLLCASLRAESDPNDFEGSDNERIAAAIPAAHEPGGDGVVRISSRRSQSDARSHWLLDSAILLPSDTTLVLQNCVLKLSDECRDNFIRSANCGLGVEKVAKLRNIRIIGEGASTLVGADRPRATGDSGKRLGVNTYGTDAGRDGEAQTGDWRNIGVLLANVENFQIENLTIRNAHAWSVSLEKCRVGRICNLTFDSEETREIDGRPARVLNVDGVDLRKGCRDVVIDGIFGRTGDDLVAVTAIERGEKLGGVLGSTEVCDYSNSENLDARNIVIRNVCGYAAGGHQIVRLLNSSGIKIEGVLIDGVIDASPEGIVDRATIRIGDSNPAWGGVTPLGDTRGVIVTNIQSRSRCAVLVAGSLVDSIISNVVNYSPEVTGVTFESGEKNVRNLRVENWINANVASSGESE